MPRVVKSASSKVSAQSSGSICSEPISSASEHVNESNKADAKVMEESSSSTMSGNKLYANGTLKLQANSIGRHSKTGLSVSPVSGTQSQLMNDLPDPDEEGTAEERLPITPRIELPFDKPWKLPTCDVSVNSRRGHSETPYLSPPWLMSTPRKGLPQKRSSDGGSTGVKPSRPRPATPPLTSRLTESIAPPSPAPVPVPFRSEPEALSASRILFAARVTTPPRSSRASPRVAQSIFRA